MRHFLLTVTLCVALVPPVEAAAPVVNTPTDAEIRSILQQRVDTFHQGVGIVVGVVEPKGRRLVAYGRLAKGDPRPLDGKTLFEIGSVTKVFTSLLLADMVQRGEVTLTDPVIKYLPKEAKMPQRNGRSITLQDLSNQTSGLPRMPDNFAPKDAANPYADYTPEQLYQFLTTYQLTREIGSTFGYSNLGVGLLGQALTQRVGMDFETLVRTRIGTPLGLKSTGIALNAGMKARLALGHNNSLEPVANWDIPTLAGAGALRSDAEDMLTFLSGFLGYTPSSLSPAMAAMLSPRKPTGEPGMDIALAWLVSTKDGSEIFWHNGGTGGYRTFAGINLKTGVGVVVLSNASTETGVDDIGMHLLDPSRPLLSAPKEQKAHAEIALDPKRLDGLVGRYQLAPNFILTVSREGDGLFVQATGQAKGQIFPEGERRFFAKVVDAQFTFEPAVNGKAPGLVLHQGGRDMPAKRMEGEAPAATPQVPLARQEITVEPKQLDRFVGRYALAPAFILTITQEGGRLFAQATNQPKFELFAETASTFFLKEVDAQVSFETDAQGKTTGLILHQNGAHMPAKRMD